MVMHKVTEDMEKGLPPDPETIAGVGRLIEEGAKDGAFLSGEGLKPTSQRLHLAYQHGTRTITEGPFTDAKELDAGFALLRVGSKEEAIAWCDRFAAVLGEVSLFLGPVVEPWDLGMMPEPDGAPLRFLALHQATASSESEGPPDAAMMAKMGALVDEMKKAGVLQATQGLAATKHGARIRFEGGKRTVIDGPFAESKELVAGYAILELPSKAVAIEWATRFAEVVKVNEVDVRQLYVG
jgi:hypothetical protein